MDISLNGTLITHSTNTYPYRAMLETLLSYGEDSKKSQLTSALFYKDEASKMDATSIAANERNEGLFQRRALAVSSREFDMMGRLHADLFFQDRFMLNEIGVKIKLVRSKDAFCLMGATAAKVKIVHASMFVRKVKLMSSYSSLMPRLWRTELQNIPYVAWCVKRLQYRRTIGTSVTRNCFPVSCPLASWSDS